MELEKLKINVVSFDGNDWENYKFHLKNFCYSNELTELLTKKLEESSEDEPTMKKRRKLWAYFNTTIGNSVIPLVRHIVVGDTATFWATLKSRYESNSLAMLKDNVKSWINTKQNGTTVESFMDRLETLKGRISATMDESKESIVDIASTMILLDGLDSEFDTVKQAMLLQLTKLTYAECRAQIIRHAEAIRIGTTTTVAPTVQALAANTGSSTGLYCTHCKMNGHTDDNCGRLHPELRPKRHYKGSHYKTGNRKSQANAVSNAWLSKVASDSYKASAIIFDLDSGAGDHFVKEKELCKLTNFKKRGILSIHTANDAIVKSIGYGSIPGKIQKVHVVPSFACNLLSVAQLNDDNKAVLFHPHKGVLITDATTDTVIAKGYREGKQFKLDIHTAGDKHTGAVNTVTSAQPTMANTASVEPAATIQLWLRRLGYPGTKRLYHALDTYKLAKCTMSQVHAVANADAIVARDKSTLRPHRDLGGRSRCNKPFGHLYIDIKVMPQRSWGGSKYNVVIVDDYTRYYHVLPVKEKSDLCSALEQWLCTYVRSKGYKCTNILADNGGEGKSTDIEAMCRRLNIDIRYTDTNSSASNGVVERSIGVLQTTANTLRTSAGLPPQSWAECYKTAAHLHNLLTCKHLKGKSPYEKVNGKKCDITYLRAIGSPCFVYNNDRARKALDPNSTPGVLIGYSEKKQAYRVLVDKSAGRVIESSSVTFREQLGQYVIASPPGHIADTSVYTLELLPSPPESEPPVEQIEHVNEDTKGDIPTDVDANDNADHEVTLALKDTESINDYIDPALQWHEVKYKKSAKYRAVPVQTRSMTKEANTPPPTAALTKVTRSSAKQAISKGESHCYIAKIPYSQAKQDARFRAAMLDELRTLFRNKVVEVVDRPPGRGKLIGTTWAHKLKTDADGKISRARSRLCVQGFTQVKDVDYDADGTKAPTLDLHSVTLLVALYVQYNMCGTTLDVDKAFQIPEVKEDLYIEWPQGTKPVPGKCLKLRNSLYGLKQAAHDWHQVIHALLAELGFQSIPNMPCLYYTRVGDELTVIGLYVDDIKIISQSTAYLKELTAVIGARLPVKCNDQDLFLGIRIRSDDKTGKTYLDQTKQIDDLLQSYKMADCNPVATPVEPNSKLSKTTDKDDVADFPYNELLGSLLWIARATRPDILYAVGQCSKHIIRPNQSHVTALKRILRYLKGTKDLKLTYCKGDKIELEAYSDSDFAGEPEENENPMKSTTGVVVNMKGTGYIYGCSSLQTVIAKSTAEAEYIALSACGAIVDCLRQALRLMGVLAEGPTVIHGDNQAAIVNVKSPLCGAKSRHIKIHFHYVKQLVKDGDIQVVHTSTQNNVADIMTKALPRETFQIHRKTLLHLE